MGHKKSPLWIKGILIYSLLHDHVSHTCQGQGGEWQEEKGKEKLERLEQLTILFYLKISQPECTSSSS